MRTNYRTERNPEKRATRLTAGVALLLLALLAGCASPTPRDRYLQEMQLGNVTNLVAYRAGTNLEIRISLPGKAAYAHASWPATDNTATDYERRFEMLTFDSEERAAHRSTVVKTNLLPIRSAQEWRRLVQKIFAGLAAAQPGHGALFLIQNEELVVFRDKEGKTGVVELGKKPVEIVVDRTFDDADFARAALALVKEGIANMDANGKQFLFLTGSEPAFVFIDLQQRLVVFLSYPSDRESPQPSGVLAVRALSSLLVRSLIVTAIKNPVTLVARGFWHLGTSGAAALRPTPELANPTNPPPPLATGPGMDLAAWEKELDKLVAERRYQGKVDFFIDGEKFFPALIQSVEGATKSVDAQVYIFETDDYAVKVADVLKARSSAAHVRVLLDDMGSLFGGTGSAGSSARDFHAPLSIENYLRTDSKVAVRATANPWLTLDHRKCFIIDGRQAYVGGMNIGREYRFEWHDMMAGLTGPIVGWLEKDYEKAWMHAGPLGDFGYAWISLFEPAAKRRNTITNGIGVRPLRTATGRVEIYQAQLAAIQRARSYIYIENAYFDDNSILQALMDARRRGVDVRVIFPAVNDSGVMQTSDAIVGNELIASGARVYVYPGMTHVKAAIYDGWACLGSANLTKMSLRVGQELNIAFSDADTVNRLKKDLFETDFKRARELTKPVPMDWTGSFVKYFADQL
jgi:cardiolipin synthase A/B